MTIHNSINFNMTGKTDGNLSQNQKAERILTPTMEEMRSGTHSQTKVGGKHDTGLLPYSSAGEKASQNIT